MRRLWELGGGHRAKAGADADQLKLAVACTNQPVDCRIGLNEAGGSDVKVTATRESRVSCVCVCTVCASLAVGDVGIRGIHDKDFTTSTTSA